MNFCCLATERILRSYPIYKRNWKACVYRIKISNNGLKRFVHHVLYFSTVYIHFDAVVPFIYLSS